MSLRHVKLSISYHKCSLLLNAYLHIYVDSEEIYVRVEKNYTANIKWRMLLVQSNFPAFTKIATCAKKIIFLSRLI